MKNISISFFLCSTCIATSPKRLDKKKNINTYISSSKQRRNELKTSEFTQNATSLYGEYGITDRLTAIGYFKQNSYETTNKVSGYGDVKLNNMLS
jgi:hypothetical protein